MNVIQAISDRKLFRPFLADREDSLASWQNWGTALRCLYGLPLKSKYEELVKTCTGRSIESMPASGFNTALFLVGRRGGKSRIAAIVGAWESCLSGKWELLAPGESGMVAILAPTRKQGRVIRNYLRAIFEIPLLENEVVRETQEGFELANGIIIEIMIADFRSIRGYTLLAAICDEVCFMHLAEEGKIRSDTELIRAIKPSLSTLNGLLLCVSSKYMKRGWAHTSWKKNFGNDNAKTLVWEAPSRLMNSTLSQEIVDEALLEDRAAALSEYMNEWRSDIGVWLPPEVIEAVVHAGRKELLPRKRFAYHGFADCSGGRVEDSTLAVAHADEKKIVVVDFLKVYKSPHSPLDAISDMAGKLKRFGLHKVTADNYAGEFVVGAFRRHGIVCHKCKLPKSALYLELIPVICSKNVELLDDETLIKQLCGLERHTHSGGKDKVDHAQGQKDDCANSVAGAVFIAGKRKQRVGGFFQMSQEQKAVMSVCNV